MGGLPKWVPERGASLCHPNGAPSVAHKVGSNKGIIPRGVHQLGSTICPLSRVKGGPPMVVSQGVTKGCHSRVFPKWDTERGSPLGVTQRGKQMGVQR
jgi:hypothetical protein